MNQILVASGESNFYDHLQDRELNGGSGINASFPNPSNAISGVYQTYASSAQIPNQYDSGIFNFNYLASQFSNANTIDITISDFDTFNPYIHYYRTNNQPVEIPFISTYRVSVVYNPYRRRF